ncbi:Molybdenum import ATP-binding protein ModC [Trichinella pseudospiralis]
MANIYGSNYSTDVPQTESSNATSLPDVLTEIKNLLAALSVFVLAMTIVTLAALQLKFCIYRMKRNRHHKATQGYPNTSEPLKNMNISAISESVKSPKKINFLAKLDEFEILTPLTPNTAQTNFVALLPPTVPYNRSPGRITLFPLSCSLRRVNLNRIYCSPDRPDIVFSLYDSMKAFNGTTGGNEELDLISVDRTSYASVVDKNNPTDNKRGTSELTEQCVVNEKKKSQHCADSDAYPSSISSITTDDDIPSLSKSSGREDSANVSFSATEYTSDKNLTKFNDGTSEMRVPSSGVSPFYGLRTKNTYSENNGNISTFDNFSLRLTNLDKIVEETESETDNSRPTYRMEEQIIPISLSHYEK